MEEKQGRWSAQKKAEVVLWLEDAAGDYAVW